MGGFPARICTHSGLLLTVRQPAIICRKIGKLPTLPGPAYALCLMPDDVYDVFQGSCNVPAMPIEAAEASLLASSAWAFASTAAAIR